MTQGNDPAPAIDGSATIARPVAAVFAFYRDFTHLPQFLGDVVAIEPVGPETTRWAIQGPLGVEVHWTAVVSDVAENAYIFYETTSDLMKTRWRVFFAKGTTANETIVREEMLAPGGTLAQAALTAIGKNPAEEVHHNLNRLKQLLETGRVTDTAYAVPGKFTAR